MKKLLILLVLSTFFIKSKGQITVSVTITGGVATTTCNDIIGAPDPFWSVNIEGQGWLTYPADGGCYNNVPNVQYTEIFPCVNNLPATIEVCFRAFENDPLPLICDEVPTCNEEICQNYAIPAPGTNSNELLELGNGLDSDGFVNFSITTIEQAPNTNNDICNAIDLGVLTRGGQLGDVTQGIYNNFCAGNANEPNPLDDGFFFNDAGVWFTITTDNDLGNLSYFEALNDPQGLGEEIDLQLAIYESDNDACNGNMTLIGNVSDNNSFDGTLRLICLEPNRTYFFLVDGGSTNAADIEGVFGLQATNIDIQEGGDARCDAEDLGAIPENGSATIGPRSNFCATDAGDPFVPAFVSQQSVWFSFEAPPSGHVLIEGIAETQYVPLGVQLALYRSFNGTCTGFFQHIESVYTDADLDETLQVSCLFPGQTYYILVDGSGNDTRGIFNITVSDAGDITPITDQDVVLCAGANLIVGTSNYTQSGVYADTLQLFAGCDSIVNTNLTILDPLVVTINTIEPALGQGNANGVAEAVVSGGAGNYQIDWCNGETGTQANALIGGDNCCVTVTDANNCVEEVCFDIEFITDIIPFIQNDTVDCNGDLDGSISFYVENGEAPYNYSWTNTDNTLGDAGIINAAGETIQVNDLPAGDYIFTVNDAFDDTTFTIVVVEPAPLTVGVVSVADASCFNVCDGAVEVIGIGGNGGYQYTWSDGLGNTANPQGICANTYNVTVTDAKGCQATLLLAVEQPPEFIATAAETNPVSCFEGADGVATVTTNGQPTTYNWDNGATTASISDLTAGFYSVTVTNIDGCEAFSTIEITEPDAPLVVSIELDKEISCNGESDGVLGIQISGPGTNFTYSWSNGNTTATASGLSSGNYSILLENEKGCTATDDFLLEEPTEVVATLTAVDITCLDPPNGGAIRIDDVTGGTPDYTYSLDGVIYNNVPIFPGLFEGSYEVLIRDAAGCEISLPTEVLGPPVLTVTLGEDQVIQLGETVELEALANSSTVVYTWKPEQDSLIAGGSTSVIRPFQSGTYSVSVLDTASLCTAEDFIFISVNTDRRVYIPNAFSPNLDGSNDMFTIYGSGDIVEIKTLRIFGRNGMQVFESTNFQPNNESIGWDGTFEGDLLNSGVFVYFAEIEFLDGLTEIFKGEVVLVK